MRIAIMGSGAVGGYFGALLARAGHEVAFIARGAHLEAMQRNGLKVTGPRGDFSLPVVTATDHPEGLSPVDVVLFSVKLYDTESAAQALLPLMRNGGMCISLQNGVDGQDRIGSIVGQERVLGGLAMVSGVIESPGVIRYTSDMSSLRFGESDGRRSQRALRFSQVCLDSGFAADLVDDIRSVQWQKFVGLATNASLTALVRLPVGVVYHDPLLTEVALAAFTEVRDVALAQGIAMPGDIVDRVLALHRSFPPGMYASMYHDLARGKPLELDSLGGVVVRRGAALGVPTPVHGMAYACLKPFLHGPHGPLPERLP